MSDSFIADMEEISGNIARHQIETRGREWTQEEHEQLYEELHEESMRKYAGMTPVEAVRVQTQEIKKWEKEMAEKHGAGFFDGYSSPMFG
jgi:hypothetical protein